MNKVIESEVKRLLKENQELLINLEIKLKKINELLLYFVTDKQKTTHLEELRYEVVSYILETNQ
ncbi:MAG: hypothetical protein NY202_04415 [Mollicutes bacterium UO1]